MTIVEKTVDWQGTGGPVEWDLAWDRVRELLATRSDRFGDRDSDGSQEDGSAALATALYITARGQHMEPSAVPRRAVEDLLARRAGETDGDVLRRWAEHLERLGHDLEDTADPVCTRWRRLRYDHDEKDRGLYWDDSLARHGFGYTAIGYLLSEHVSLDF